MHVDIRGLADPSDDLLKVGDLRIKGTREATMTIFTQKKTQTEASARSKIQKA